MECMRCQGLMVVDHFLDLQGTGGLMWMKGWRCMNCGHVVDPLLEQNRCLQEAPLLGMAEAPVEFATEEVYLEAERGSCI